MDIRKVIFLITGIVFIGTFGFMQIENLGFFDAIHLTISTITTVGYGDITPETTLGRLFSDFVMVFGIGAALYAIGIIMELFIGGRVEEVFKEVLRLKDNNKNIQDMSGHTIVCGFGRVGNATAHGLRSRGIELVVIDNSDEMLKKMPEEVAYIVGNATQEDVLVEAGVERAETLITTLPSDGDNILITLTGKSLNPKLRCVARASTFDSERQMYHAGAEIVVIPEVMGAIKVVGSILSPDAYDFIAPALAGEARWSVDSVSVDEGSPMLGKSIEEIGMQKKTGAIIIGIKRGGKYASNPPSDFAVTAGDVLIVFGDSKQIGDAAKLLSG